MSGPFNENTIKNLMKNVQEGFQNKVKIEFELSCDKAIEVIRFVEKLTEEGSKET